MIHHISIAADNPQHVAQVLAELFEGQVIPFVDHAGSYVALAFDVQGTLIIVHPRGMELLPGSGEDGVQHQETSNTSIYTATHAAISVSISEAQIRSIAAREGWRVVRCNHGGYIDVIELWVENQLLLELLPPEMSAQYLAITQPQAFKQFLETYLSRE